MVGHGSPDQDIKLTLGVITPLEPIDETGRYGNNICNHRRRVPSAHILPAKFHSPAMSLWRLTLQSPTKRNPSHILDQADLELFRICTVIEHKDEQRRRKRVSQCSGLTKDRLPDLASLLVPVHNRSV